jgi:hypothetical protein
MFLNLMEIKPQVATAISTLQVVAGVGVWAESIQGIAAFFTILVSVPTAILALIYWSYQVKMIIKKNKKENLDDE